MVVVLVFLEVVIVVVIINNIHCCRWAVIGMRREIAVSMRDARLRWLE